MNTQTILLIIAAAILALGIAVFQYGYKPKRATKRNIIFAFLRFLSVFGLLILLINPKFKQQTYYTEKPTLVVAVDNSTSIKHLKQEQNVLALVDRLKNNQEIASRFDVAYYAFGNSVRDTSGFSFDRQQTNIAKTLQELDQIYDQEIAPTLLITDGNQTYGNDYQYVSKNYKQQIFPVILGDTITYTDLKIQQLNVNKYAYLKNKFPVETILVYNGKEQVKSKFVVKSGQNTVYTQEISFSPADNSKVIQFNLPANKVGVIPYRAQIVPLAQERNMINNQKNFAVEVIDQKTNILIISTMVHPDLGAIKRAVESNERRSATIKKPSEVSDVNEYQLVILYQPDASFRPIFTTLQKFNKNHFTITGSKADWNFLNTIQSRYRHDISRQTENFLPELNSTYSTFLIDDIGFDAYPPLLGIFGDPTIVAEHQILLYQKVGNVTTTNPLLVTIEENGSKEGVLFGEDIWKWRAQEFVQQQSFERFDDFFGKLIQYLASNKRKSRLEVTSESFYYGNLGVKLQAAYFTKNYEFDRRGNLTVTIKNSTTQSVDTFPLLLKNNNYEVDLSNLQAGKYEFTVQVRGEKLSRSGSFTILDFDVEQQFLNADVSRLQQVAKTTNGASFFMNQENALIQKLLEDNRYQPIQKSKENIVSLIDWEYILMLIIITLAIEWFMRKYNGLI